MRRPSLALVRQSYTPDGGAERFVLQTLEALRGQDLALTLITRAWKDGDGFEILTCNPRFVGRIWRDWSFARGVCREVGKRHFDLVQSHERIRCCDIYRAGDGVHREWLRQRRRQLGLLARLGVALNPYHWYVLAAERALFESARLKAVICNSRMVRDEILHYFRIPPEKLNVIYNGVDLDSFHPGLRRHRDEIRARYAIPRDAPLFLFVGSGFERKGVAMLLDALALLPPDTHLLVVGRDKNQRRFAARAHEHGLGARVHFLGSQPDVTPYYGAADALVLPTLYDPFPNVVLEAMASGLPVVTSTKSGAAEIIEHGRNGLVCDALDRPALVHAMQSLISPSARAAIGAAARTTVSSISIEAASRQMRALYARLSEHRATDAAASPSATKDSCAAPLVP